jgi:serralysin
VTVYVIDPSNPLPPMGEVISAPIGEFPEIVEDVITLPPLPPTGEVFSIPRGEFPEIVEDMITIPPLPSPGDVILIPREEFPEMVEKPATAPTTAVSFTRIGGKKADVLKGGTGNDLLNGRLGMDKLMGQEGADVFAFTTKLGKANVDWILDFQHADDTINLSKAVFSKLQKGSLSKDAFWVGAKAHDETDRIIYDGKTGALSYDADGSSTKHSAIKFAQVKAGTLLKADDFFIV